MMCEILKFSVSDTVYAAPAFEIRRKVFVEEQNVPAEEEFDQFEDESNHFLALKNNIPVGTARWRYTDTGIKLERFAVLKEFRNQNVGGKILSAILDDVKPHEKRVYLHAQVPAIAFYQKFGFIKKGEMFLECDIEHYKMELDL
jgi:predicted GNAT family N-acyltransferase